MSLFCTAAPKLAFNHLVFQPEEIVAICVNPATYHLIQKKIKCSASIESKYIIESITQNDTIFRHVMENKYGSLLVQDLLIKLAKSCESCTNVNSTTKGMVEFELLERLMAFIHRGADHFVKHETANFVIQTVLKTNFLRAHRKHIILNHIINNILDLSQEKHASNLVEVALMNSTPKCLEIFVNKHGRDALDVLMFNKYGNYVVQTLLKVLIYIRHGLFPGDPTWFDYLAKKIIKQSHSLLQYNSGKSILSHIEDEMGVRFTKKDLVPAQAYAQDKPLNIFYKTLDQMVAPVEINKSYALANAVPVAFYKSYERKHLIASCGSSIESSNSIVNESNESSCFLDSSGEADVNSFIDKLCI
uniref:PUM-HD domain-containing protein n=1 Tax=Acrobeloides nanus TaxID=290746 RepID=A0A914CN01_9BILA